MARPPATRRKPKPDEVLFFFGRLAQQEPDYIAMWGGEATKRHANSVIYGFIGGRLVADESREVGWRVGDSLLKSLDDAGFDTTTIQFSIKLKKPAPRT